MGGRTPRFGRTLLRTLSLTIVGAKLTCLCFKRALSGIVAMPSLEHLALFLGTCEVGDRRDFWRCAPHRPLRA